MKILRCFTEVYVRDHARFIFLDTPASKPNHSEAPAVTPPVSAEGSRKDDAAEASKAVKKGGAALDKFDPPEKRAARLTKLFTAGKENKKGESIPKNAITKEGFKAVTHVDLDDANAQNVLKAVKELQAAAGIPVNERDGILGPGTYTALIAAKAELKDQLAGKVAPTEAAKMPNNWSEFFHPDTTSANALKESPNWQQTLLDAVTAQGYTLSALNISVSHHNDVDSFIAVISKDGTILARRSDSGDPLAALTEAASKLPKPKKEPVEALPGNWKLDGVELSPANSAMIQSLLKKNGYEQKDVTVTIVKEGNVFKATVAYPEKPGVYKAKTGEGKDTKSAIAAFREALEDLGEKPKEEPVEKSIAVIDKFELPEAQKTLPSFDRGTFYKLNEQSGSLAEGNILFVNEATVGSSPVVETMDADGKPHSVPRENLKAINSTDARVDAFKAQHYLASEGVVKDKPSLGQIRMYKGAALEVTRALDDGASEVRYLSGNTDKLPTKDLKDASDKEKNKFVVNLYELANTNLRRSKDFVKRDATNEEKNRQSLAGAKVEAVITKGAEVFNAELGTRYTFAGAENPFAKGETPVRIAGKSPDGKYYLVVTPDAKFRGFVAATAVKKGSLKMIVNESAEGSSNEPLRNNLQNDNKEKVDSLLAKSTAWDFGEAISADRNIADEANKEFLANALVKNGYPPEVKVSVKARFGFLGFEVFILLDGKSFIGRNFRSANDAFKNATMNIGQDNLDKGQKELFKKMLAKGATWKNDTSDEVKLDTNANKELLARTLLDSGIKDDSVVKVTYTGLGALGHEIILDINGKKFVGHDSHEPNIAFVRAIRTITA